MKKYLIVFVLFGFAVLASQAEAVNYNSDPTTSPVLKVTPVVSGTVVVPGQSVTYTAPQIREKIAMIKTQIVSMQEQVARLEKLAIEAEAKGKVEIRPMDLKPAGASLNASTQANLQNMRLEALKNQVFFGHKGEDVRKLQEVLRAKGYLKANADGSFGPKTLEAVKAYQNAMKLKVSGSLDAETLNSINASTEVSGGAEIQ